MISDSTGCIVGRYWYDGEQRVQYTFRFQSEGITVESDSNGVYTIPNLPPGIYFQRGLSNGVEVVAGDTTFADISEGESYSNFIPLNEFSFRIVSDQEVSPNGFVISVGSDRYGRFVRFNYRISSDGVITVKLPSGVNTLLWSLPGFPEQIHHFRDCPATRRQVNELYLPSEFPAPWQEELQLFSHMNSADYPLSTADSEMYEFCANGRSINHLVLNLYSKGQYLGLNRYPPQIIENLERQMFKFWISVVKLVDEDYTNYDYTSGYFEHIWFSASREYALIVCRKYHEPYGFNYRWLLWNTVSGESSEIDLFPEYNPGQEKSILHYSDCGYSGVSAFINIANDGGIIARYRDDSGVFEDSRENLRTYSSVGEQILNIALPDHGFVNPIVSDDCTGWAYMYNNHEEGETVVMLGDIESYSCFNIDSLQIGTPLDIDISHTGNYLAFYGRTNGLWLFDKRTGEIRQIFSSGMVSRNSIVFSPDETKLACKIVGNYRIPSGEYFVRGNTSCTVFDISKTEVDMLTSFNDFSLAYTSSPLAVSNSGMVLLGLHERERLISSNNRVRVALIDIDGNLAWLGHYIDTGVTVLFRQENWGRFASWERICFFSDGDQTHCLFLGGED